MGRLPAAFLTALALAFALVASRPTSADEGDGGPVIDQLDRKVVLLDSFPAGLPGTGKVTLSGRLLAGNRVSRIAFIAPNGRAEYADPQGLTMRGERFSAVLSLDSGKGVYRIEVTTTAPQGQIRTAVRLRVFVGVPVARTDEPMPPDDDDDLKEAPFVLERRVAASIAQFRKAAGVDPLPLLEPMSAAARAHAVACAQRNMADTRVDAAGDLAQRLSALYRWPGVSFAMPSGPPAPGPTGPTVVVTIAGVSKSMDRLLADWRRRAALMVPLTDDRWTHLGVGIAPARGLLWVVVGLAQVNGDDVGKDVESRFTTLLSDYRAADTPARRAALLRDLSLWDRKDAAREAQKHASGSDPDLKAAGWDAKAVLDEAVARRDAVELVKRAEADAAQGRPASALAATQWMAKCLWARFLSEPAAALRRKIEADAQQALDTADALAKDGKSDEAKAAWDSLAAKYPGTPAASAAQSRAR